MIKFKHKGSFKNTFSFFGRALSAEYLALIDKYARDGVAALSAGTPVLTGESSSSWSYKVESSRRGTKIFWTNDNKTSAGVPIVILLQYGHGTGTGGYVQGHDFINPAMQPVFDNIANEVWREVGRE